MIQKMRELAPALMIVIIIAFVGGTIFLDWGMNVMGQGPATEAGKINGKKIPLEHFDRLVNMERMRVQEASRDVRPEQYRMIPQQVWNQEVSRVLLDETVKKMRLESTAHEIFEYLRRNPIPGVEESEVFQTNGSFDLAKYEQWLNTPQTYTMYPWMIEIENQVSRQILPGMKLDALLKAGVFVTPVEAAHEHAARNERATFEYYKALSRSFRNDENDTAGITERMISDFYAANQSRFQEEEQADLYFLKIPKIATESDLVFNRQALADIKKQIETGEFTFEAAAEAESDCEGSAQNGGDLGWFGRGQMVPEFEAVAFELEIGKISDPVKTTFGYHLIKVEERSEPDTADGANMRVRARHILVKDAPTNETLDALSEQAEELRRVVIAEGFAAAAAVAGMPVVFDSTGLFKRGDLPPKIGYLSGTGSFIFSRRSSEISDPLDNQDAIYILAVRERVRKGVRPLSAVRGQIIESLKDTLAMRGARAHTQQTLEKARGGATLEELKETDNIVAGLAEDQSAGGFIPNLGPNSRTAHAALALPAGTLSGLIRERDGYSFVRTISRAENNREPELVLAQKAQIADMWRTQGRQSAYGEWFRNLRGRSRVVSNIERFYLD